MISRFTRRSFLLAACLATFTAVCVAQTSDQRLQEVATSETVQFTGALAQNAISAVDLALPPSVQGSDYRGAVIVRSITIVSVQNLAWEVQFRRLTTNVSTDPNTDVYLGRWSFVATDAVQNAGAGDYLYYIDGLAIPVRDDGYGGVLHLVLVNRSAAAKNAGATGYITIRVQVQQMVMS